MIEIPDFSHHQGEIDWDAYKRSGAPVAIIRAGSCYENTGICYTDSQFTRNVAYSDPLPLIIYWFFRPNWDILAQAEYWANLVRPLNRPFALAPDIETSGKLPASEVIRRSDAFIRHVARLVPQARQILYSNQNYIKNIFEPVGMLKMLPLWLSAPGWVNPPPLPAGWGPVMLHQFTFTGDKHALYGVNRIESKGLDLNRWQGSLQELYDLCGVTQPAPQPDPEPPMQFTYERLLKMWNHCISQGMKP